MLAGATETFPYGLYVDGVGEVDPEVPIGLDPYVVGPDPAPYTFVVVAVVGVYPAVGRDAAYTLEDGADINPPPTGA
jgi:hypothetical protein